MRLRRGTLLKSVDETLINNDKQDYQLRVSHFIHHLFVEEHM